MNFEVINQVINQVISLFLIILIGIYASKKKILTAEINKGLTSFLLRITLPIYIINSFNIEYTSNIITTFFYSTIAFVITILISYITVSFIKVEKKKVLQFGIVFSNCGFIGFPVIGSIFGPEGIVYGSIFNVIFTIFLWTFGVMLYNDKFTWEEIKNLIYNPRIIAVLIGLPIMIFQIKIPIFVLNSMDLVGSMTGPLSMIIVGFMLSRVKIKQILEHKLVLYGTFIKLIIVPAVLFSLAKLIGLHSMVITTVILLEAMPVGVMTSIFAENYEEHQEFVAIYVFVSTLISILTIPFIYYISRVSQLKLIKV